MTVTGFAYAQARLQSRHGARPDAATWQRLHASTSVGHFLETARSTSLRSWVAHLAPSQTDREMERRLRAAFAEHVAEVGRWVPPPWGPAVEWVRDIPLLPFAWARARGAAVSVPELDARAAALPSSDDASPLAAWSARWPRVRAAHRAALVALGALIDEHVQRSAKSAPDADGFMLRRALHDALVRFFRQYPEQPATVFTHLALAALDLETLRGALARRAVLGDVQSEVAWV